MLQSKNSVTSTMLASKMNDSENKKGGEQTEISADSAGTTRWKQCAFLYKTQQKIERFLQHSSVYTKSRIQKYWKSYLILLVIHVISILAILQADVYYEDDMSRTLYGNRSFTSAFGRWVSDYLSTFLHTGKALANIAPIPQLIAAAICAASALILIRVLTGTNRFSRWSYAAVIPLGLSPYFLQCLSYQYDAPYMALSVFFCVFPLLFLKRKLWLYLLLSFFCQLFMCETYQASSGIYPMLVILLCFLAWNRGENFKSIRKFFFGSVIAYAAALILFEILCYQFSNPEGTSITYVDVSIPTGLAFFENAFENYKTYYSLVRSDFRRIWKLLIAAIVLFFFFITTRESKRKKWISFLCSVIVFCILLLLTFGVYPFLSDPITHPRAMYGFGALLAMLAIVIVNAAAKLLNLPGKCCCAALGWCFFIFASIYGNALQIQEDYTDIRTQAIIDDLIDLDVMNADKELYFQLDFIDSSWESPVLKRNPPYTSRNIVKRLIVNCYTRWDERKFAGCYDLNFTIDSSYDLSTYDLPLLVDNEYHEIYGNEEYIYVVVK